MVYQNKVTDLVTDFCSLSLAISKLMDKQEKNYGCFRVKKEEDFYSLYIPGIPSLKLYQNYKSQVYKGYWTEYGIPDLKNRNCKPDITIRKKQKQVKDSKKNMTFKQRTFEIVYRYDECPEIRIVNQIVTSFIKSKIEASIISVPVDEIMPLVLKVEV